MSNDERAIESQNKLRNCIWMCNAICTDSSDDCTWMEFRRLPTSLRPTATNWLLIHYQFHLKRSHWAENAYKTFNYIVIHSRDLGAKCWIQQGASDLAIEQNSSTVKLWIEYHVATHPQSLFRPTCEVIGIWRSQVESNVIQSKRSLRATWNMLTLNDPNNRRRSVHINLMIIETKLRRSFSIHSRH